MNDDDTIPDNIVGEDGKITSFEGSGKTLLIKTPSRMWQGEPKEFQELKEALSDVQFEGDGEEL